MDKAMKYGVIAVAISSAFAGAVTWAAAQQVRYGTELICDTAEQLERFVACRVPSRERANALRFN